MTYISVSCRLHPEFSFVHRIAGGEDDCTEYCGIERRIIHKEMPCFVADVLESSIWAEEYSSQLSKTSYQYLSVRGPSYCSTSCCRSPVCWIILRMVSGSSPKSTSTTLALMESNSNQPCVTGICSVRMSFGVRDSPPCLSS